MRRVRIARRTKRIVTVKRTKIERRSAARRIAEIGTIRRKIPTKM